MVERKKPSLPPDPDAPATEEEIRESRRLRDALDEGGDHPLADLARAAKAADAGGELAPAELDAIVLAALAGEPAASEEEAAAAEELRAGLEDASRVNEGADFARALRAAWAPREIGRVEHARIVEGAIAPKKQESGGRVIRVAFGAVATITALAASVWIFVSVQSPEVQRGATAELAKARSTQPLFDEPFKAGSSTARIDKIAVARSTDFRENRFKRWGVR
jgi:hypothetical protein